MNVSVYRKLRLLLLSPGVCAGIGSLRAQQEYTGDGVPTAAEEEVRWLTNRGRFDRNNENATQGTNYQDADIPVSSGPLAPSNSLTLAARHHTEDMAVKNQFQHATVPGSAYYNANTQPEPWQRFLAEGYMNLVPQDGWAENLSAAVQTASDTHKAWWNSTEHRKNMSRGYFLEIGAGYYFWAPSTYDHYWTMTLAAGQPSFFTDTMFRDTNADSKYTQGEGVSGVKVTLKVNGADHTTFDVSAAPGSFAVPLSGIAVEPTAEVWLTNQSGTAIILSIPRDYRTLESVTLASAQSFFAGTFSRGIFGKNFGFRNLTRGTAPVTAPLVTLTKNGAAVTVSWPSQTDLQYLVQSSTTLGGWTDFPLGYQNGTGGVMTVTDTSTVPKKYYRVSVKRP
ncbi:MAG TPA: CAP domain-containing protein [Verrucomicrobiales bacterium]|nr:CAP domain-containing protein [Verrucomicrobiales bacterium]